jgi:hypothetical protein
MVLKDFHPSSSIQHHDLSIQAKESIKDKLKIDGKWIADHIKKVDLRRTTLTRKLQRLNANLALSREHRTCEESSCSTQKGAKEMTSLMNKRSRINKIKTKDERKVSIRPRKRMCG